MTTAAVVSACPADPAAPAVYTVEDVIADRAIRTVFQPIVHLASKAVVGFEALMRGPEGTALESPLALLDAAARVGRLAEVDWLCRAQAIEMAAAAGLPEGLSWLINVEPAGLSIECPECLAPSIDRGRTDLRVILEIVERDVEGHVLDLIRATDQARRDGWGVALDDVGAIESSLALLPFLRPDVVKLDMSLVRSVPTAEAAAITAAVRSYAERKNAVILAEGIETADQERLAVVFGATYGQGYFYGPPGPLPESVPPPRHPIPLRQHLVPIDGRSPYEFLATRTEPQRATARDLVHIRSYVEQQAAQSSHASVVLAGFHSSDYFTAADRSRYDRLARSTALTVVLADGLDQHDEPSYHIGGLSPLSAMRDEWVIIVLSPHYAVAFALREVDPDNSGARMFDFVYTFDRESVIDAARCFVQELTHTRPPLISSAAPDGPGAGRGDNSKVAAPSLSAPAHALIPAPASRAALAPAPVPYSGFRAASQAVLDYLNANVPMGFWAITRVENERQTYLLLDGNDYGLSARGSHAWQDSLCVHMAAGIAPRIAPDTAAVALYANAPVSSTLQIAAYAGAPIIEPDGTLFGAICGLDPSTQQQLSRFGPTLDVCSELLSLVLAGDRAVHAAQRAAGNALHVATTDPLTGAGNFQAWTAALDQIDLDYEIYADPTVLVVIDLDDLAHVNEGPGGYTAGHRVLRGAAGILRRKIRPADTLARLSGDQFGIVLRDTPASSAPELGRRFARALDRAGMPASIGWASMEPTITARTAAELAAHMMLDDQRRRQAHRNGCGRLPE